MLMPYLAASLPVDTIVVLVDREHATIARIQRGVVHVVDTIVADDSGDAHEQLLAGTRRKLAVIAGHDGRVVVGGAVPSVAQFVGALPDDIASRTVVSDGLHLHTPFVLIPALAHAALQPLETRRQLSLISGFARRAHLTRRGAFALDAVQLASQAGAVEQAIISMSLWERAPLAVERICQRALRSGATIEAATAECGAILEERGGIAAELRFVVDGVGTPPLAAV
jgi:stalled ribosome rescue protein Dom34